MSRVVTALFLVPIAVYSALFAPWWLLFAVVAIVATLSMREYARMTQSFAPLGCGAGILILLASPREVMLLIVLSTLAAMCLSLAAESVEKGFARAASLVLGIVYIFGSWKTGILLHDSAPQPAAFGIGAGHHWLMFGLMLNWIGDTGAYYVERILDATSLRRPLVRGKVGKARRHRPLRGLHSA
jgi:phosphatidate cytidylyltransferase